MKKLLVAILKGIWIWGLLSWLYVVGIVFNPLTAPSQFWPLSVYVPLPTNLFGVSGFAISFVAFIAWEWLHEK